MDVRAQEKLFKKLFSPKSLFDVYTERFSKSAAKASIESTACNIQTEPERN